MKKNIYQKIISMLLVIITVILMIPTADLNTWAATSKNGGYLFTYFTGEGTGEQLHFAVSEDGYNFEPLNGNDSVIEAPDVGTGHIRDPYILKGQDDKYYILATDLNANASSYSNTSLYTWSSENLTDWTLNSHIDMNSYISGTTRAWAPQAMWDSTKKQYMLYWAQQTNSGSTTLYYAYTDDFKTLTTPTVLFAPKDGIDTIDGDITYNEKTGKYSLLFKDESESSTSNPFGKKVCLALSDSLNGPYAYSDDQEYIKVSIGSTDYEGCQVYKITGTDTYNLLMDNYSNGGSGFIMYTSDDLVNFTPVTSQNYDINSCSPRHGSVIAISDSEYDSLVEKYGKMTITQRGLSKNDNALNHLIARYFVGTDVTKDYSGNNNSLTTQNLNAVIQDEKLAAKFNSDGGDSDGPKNGSYAYTSTKQMMENVPQKDGITISFDFFATKSDKIHIFDISDNGKFGSLSNTAKGQYDTFNLRTDGYFEAMSNGTVYSSNANTFTMNEWHTVTITISKNFSALYVDGDVRDKFIQTALNDSWFSELLKGDASRLGIGISSWVNDALLDGYISNFCIYDKALSVNEVQDGMKLLDKSPEKTLADNTDQIIYNDDCTGYTNTIDDDIYESVLQTSGTETTVSKIPSVNNTTVPSDGSYTISTWYNPGDTISGTMIDIGSAPNSGTEPYITISEDGTLSFKNGTSFYNASNLFTLTPNEWQYVTIQIVPYTDYEKIYVYINGNLISMHDTYLSIDAASTYPASKINDMLNNGDYTVYYGSGINNDSYSNGKFKDVTIYRNCISAKDLYEYENTIYADKLLRKAMTDFNAKIQTFSKNNILTNVSDAYKAYDAASRYLDSVTYGTAEPDIQVMAKLAKTLRDNTNAMQKFEYYNPVNTSVTMDNESTYTGDYSKNIVYAQDLNWLVGSQGDQTNNCGVQIFTGNAKYRANVEIFYGNVVFFYDGSTNNKSDFTAPIMFDATKTDANPFLKTYNRSMCGLYPTVSSTDITENKIFTLAGVSNDGYWRGINTNNYSPFSMSGTDMVAGDSSNSNNKYGSDLTAGDLYFWYNVIQFDPTTALSQNGKIAGKYNLSWAAYGTSTKKAADYASTSDTDKGTFTNTMYAFYVVDYSKVKSALENVPVDEIKNIINYTPTTATALVSSLDELTSIDPGSTDYNYANGVNSAVEKVQNVIDTGVSNFETAKNNIKLEDKADYDALKNEIINETYTNEVKALTDINPNANEFTISSTTAFLEAYNNAVEHFTALNPEGDDQQYSSSKEFIEELKNNISLKYNALMPKADYTTLKETYESNQKKTIESNGLITDLNDLNTQNYTLSSWITFDNAAIASQKLVDNKDLNAEAIYTNNEKNDQAKYTADSKTGAPITTTLSKYQTEINDTNTTLTNAMNNMAEPSDDYSAYDAFSVVLATQDKNAFVDSYLNSDESIFKLKELNGNINTAQVYDSSNTQLSNTAYITYNGVIYKNTTDIDEITSVMMSRLNEANNDASNKRKSYKVTFNVCKDGITQNVKTNELHYYGDIIQLDASDFADGLTCYKWEVTSAEEGTKKPVLNLSNDYSVRIQSDSVITAYCTSKPVSTDTIKVNVVTGNNEYAYQMNLPKTTSVKFVNRGIEINGTTYTIPNAPFYTFTGWNVNNQDYLVGTTKTLSELCNGVNLDSIIIKENSTVSSDTNEITLDGNLINGNAKYDDKITIKAPGAYAILINQDNVYSVVAYGDSYDLYANRSMKFYTLTKDTQNNYYISGSKHDFDSATKYSLDNKLPFAYSAVFTTGDSNEKYSTYSSYSKNVDENVRITERGTLYTTNASIANANDMKYGSTNINFVKTKNVVGFSNQYSLTINNAKTYFNNNKTIYTRAYVKYLYTYTDAKSNKTTTVQCIAYGNICNDSSMFN